MNGTWAVAKRAAALALFACILFGSVGCSKKEETDTSSNKNSSYYTGDDFHGKKMTVTTPSGKGSNTGSTTDQGASGSAGSTSDTGK